MTQVYEQWQNRVTTQMEAFTCAECGTPFCMAGHEVKSRREDGKTFYCPNGHGNHFGDSTVKQLERKLAEAQRQRQSALDDAAFARRETGRVQRELRAQKGQATKLRKRISAGVCPCCHRTIKDLARHMATKHPNYADAEAATKE